ncbi:MAG TPA: hypothetical protein VFK40_01760 [Nitrososphaeraceae archaeon]|nr:hypothetical protein [Nitrososphaeraceae archaeon]
MPGKFLIDYSTNKLSKMGNKSNLVDPTKKTKTMEISLNSWELLNEHGKKFHDAEEYPVSYDTCIQELCSFWNEKHNSPYMHFSRI